MIQSFDVKGGPDIGRRNLPKLRARMLKAGLDGFYVPHEDEHQNEYLPDANERLAWATGFTGSAGAALVTNEKAALFVDGRYTLQAKAQVDEAIIEVRDLIKEGPAAWLAVHAKKGARIGYDPRLVSPDAIRPLAEAAASAEAALIAVDANPLDAAWTDRPSPPRARVTPHPVEFSGEPHPEKIARLAEALAKDRIDAALLTAPASLAWLFNIRGGDVRHSPLPLGAAILRTDGSADLYLDPAKADDALRAHLGNRVTLRPEAEIESGLAGLKGRRVRVDPSVTSAWWFSRLDAHGAGLSRGADPCTLPRATKNKVEVEGARRAHARDGVAVTRFLHWLETEAQGEDVDEITAAQKLEGLRGELGGLLDLSFESISAAGPNSALPHYRVNTKSNRRLKRGSLYLIDSGGQYREGTTDVTRTAPIGRPSREMKERFTLVLKGHIALATIRFPEGTTGTHLDGFARQYLWSAGLDYDHGTGHGVGSYLGVHEGPQRIAKALNAAALQTGMIVSNEPGYYKQGGYGIRIENLLVVTEPEDIPGGERKMLGFETLTLAPIERGLIVKAMLAKAERAWLDAYHARVASVIGPRLTPAERAWLEAKCAPL